MDRQVHFAYVLPVLPAGPQAVSVLDAGHHLVGCLEYQVCHVCRIGYVANIAVASHCQGQGLGRHALHTAMAPCGGYAWSTSRQSSEGRRFFAAMEEETEVAFPARGVRCSHMRS
ncbi:MULTISPECIES: GNAT family N-acetyltransferase [Streptomyces]|uniref:GNAT family N-acetyltransferase n=1 Tax=Streptomyces TaxID=1883 RepID=UPI001E2C18CD|nr:MULTISPECIES: GNAT family N-acetyltransferase [Streptomyces]UFQ18989.1 GNAT family N-acetyltransferase [Streptomyces huasconensis]WCL88608.1 GNAT family N-acetyltransferase [Streptomyces sp. JCM 35825]